MRLKAGAATPAAAATVCTSKISICRLTRWGVEGHRIRVWKVRLRFDGQRECETDIVIREGSNVTGNIRNYRLRPGVNAIEIPANDGFRLRGREHCFNVQVDLYGSRQPVDADRRFCASQKTMWSMRESDYRRRSDR